MTAATVNGRPAWLDDTPDPVWDDFRSRITGNDWNIPRGTYDATVLSSRVAFEKGKWGIRILFRTDRLGLDGRIVQPLSGSKDDPLKMTAAQIRSLRAWATAVRIPARVPVEIIEAALGLVGEAVVARVSITPVGHKAALSRSKGAMIVPARNGNGGVSAALVDASGVTLAAHTAHQALADAVSNINTLWMIAAEACYHLREGQGWQHLGYGSLNEYLAQPELGVERSKFLKLARIWDVFAVEGRVPRERLAGLAWTKLLVTQPSVSAGEITAADAIDDVGALARRDLEEKYGGVPGDTSRNAGFRERVSDVVVAPMHDPERGRMLQVRIGDRLAELDEQHVRKLHATCEEWLRA